VVLAWFMQYRAKYLPRTIIDDQTSPSNRAQLVSNLLPALIAHTRVAPEYVVRIVRLLDSGQLGIVCAPERLLEIRFIPIGLHMIRLPLSKTASTHTSLIYAPESGSKFLRIVTLCSIAPTAVASAVGLFAGQTAPVTVLSLAKLFLRLGILPFG
jgi:hypothetical protein